MSEYDPSSESGDGAQQPWYVREVDGDMGVGDSIGIPYTYEHVEEPPEPGAEVYRVTGFIDYAEKPIHKNVYYVESGRLEEFLGDRGELFEKIVDVRPLSYAEAEREFTEFGDG